MPKASTVRTSTVRTSIVRKSLTVSVLALACALPGMPPAQAQSPANNCWVGSLVFPPDKEYTALKTYQKVYANRLKSHPEDEKLATRLRVNEEDLAKFVEGRTPAQKLFATGGAVPIAVTSKTPFFTGETLRLTFRSCTEQPIEGFCSKEAAQALAGQSVEAPIQGIGALAKDSVYGYLRLYVEPEFGGMSGRAFARVEFAGQIHWDPAQGNGSAVACPE